MEEIWKDIEGYENLYQISNFGRVKSLSRKIKPYAGGFYYSKEKIMQGSDNGKGYIVVSLFKKGKRKDFKIHQLVAIAFLNHIPCGMSAVIDHIDENKKNNRADNLQIISNRDNCIKYRLTQKKTSKYTGVHWDKKRNKWVAQIIINGKRKNLGRFINEKDASNAYQEKLNLFLNK